MKKKNVKFGFNKETITKLQMGEVKGGSATKLPTVCTPCITHTAPTYDKACNLDTFIDC